MLTVIIICIIALQVLLAYNPAVPDEAINDIRSESPNAVQSINHPRLAVSGFLHLGAFFRIMQVNETVIENALREGWISSLAFYLKAKTVFRNSCFYNHSLRATAKKIGISYGTLKNHLGKLQGTGLTRHHANNLIFSSIKHATQQDHKCTIQINKDDSIKRITQKLRVKILEYKGRHQEKAIREKIEARLLTKKCDSKFSRPTIKEVKKRDSLRHLLGKSINPDVTFSDAKLAKILVCSKGTITKLKKSIAEKIKVRKPEKLFAISAGAFSSSIDVLRKKFGQVFYYKGAAYQSFPTQYNIGYTGQ